MITAIIPHYFKEREGNIRVILDSYKDTAVTEVIIWDNTGELELTANNVIVVRSPKNIGCKGRFLAALMASNTVLLFQDNDVVIESGAIEHMRSRLHGNIVTLDARMFIDDSSYANSKHVVNPEYDTAVDISLARIEMMDRFTFTSIFNTKYFDYMNMDDIFLSWLAHQSEVGIVVPMKKEGCGFINLEEHGVGSSATPNHYALREELCKELFE